MILVSLTLFFTLFLAVSFLVRWTRVAQILPTITSRSRFSFSEPPPKVSVIVPARNEEDNIEPCVAALLDQDYGNLEILIVNDRSEDRTPHILERIRDAYQEKTGTSTAPSNHRLRIIDGKPCPPGWMGKNHALHQGYQNATGDFLLFLDADTRAHPKLVSTTVGYVLESQTGLLTLLHSCEFLCFWDSVVNTLILYMALFQKIERFNDPDDKAANAHGPFLLFKRTTYENIGGHEAIKAEVVEDLVLAERVKESRERLVWAISPDLLVSRPYESLSHLRKGWGKVLFRAIERNPRMLYMHIISPMFLALFLLFPWVTLLVVSAEMFLYGAGAVRVAVGSLALCQILTVMGTMRLLEILFRLKPVYPMLYPLGVVMLGWLQWETVLNFLTGKKMIWKGRHYREGSP